MNAHSRGLLTLPNVQQLLTALVLFMRFVLFDSNAAFHAIFTVSIQHDVNVGWHTAHRKERNERCSCTAIQTQTWSSIFSKLQLS